MKKFTKVTIAILIILATYYGHAFILSFETAESNSWFQLGAIMFVFLMTTLYWKWLKLLKKFKWDESTQKWYQVLEDHR